MQPVFQMKIVHALRKRANLQSRTVEDRVFCGHRRIDLRCRKRRLREQAGEQLGGIVIAWHNEIRPNAD